MESKKISLNVRMVGQEDEATEVNILIGRFKRHTVAILDIDNNQGSPLPQGTAVRNPADKNDPAVGDRLAVQRACLALDGKGDKMGPNGRRVYDVYRVYTRLNQGYGAHLHGLVFLRDAHVPGVDCVSLFDHMTASIIKRRGEQPKERRDE